MTYEQFMLDFWSEIKRAAVEPQFSLGEIVFIVAVLALKPPSWAVAVLMLAWLLCRNLRDDTEDEKAE